MTRDVGGTSVEEHRNRCTHMIHDIEYLNHLHLQVHLKYQQNVYVFFDDVLCVIILCCVSVYLCICDYLCVSVLL